MRRTLLACSLIALTALSCTSTEPGPGSTESAPESARIDDKLGCAAGHCLDTDVRIAAEPASLVFDDVPVGGHQLQTLRVRNVGLVGVLSVAGATFTSATSEFSVVGFKPVQLPVGGAFELNVRYRPVFGGAHETTLQIANNSSLPSQRPLAVPVSVNLQAGALVIDPNPVDFGIVGPHQAPSRVVRLHNVGTAPLHITDTSLAKGGSAGFVILDAPTDHAAIAPGDFRELTLGFASNVLGSHAGQLVVTDTTGEVSTAHLSAEKRAPVIAVAPSPLYFRHMKAGQTNTRSLTITNKGNAPLAVKSLRVADDSPVKDFTFSPAGDLVVPAGGKAVVAVTGTALKDSATTIHGFAAADKPAATIEVHSNAENKKMVPVPAILAGPPCHPKTTTVTVTQTKLTGGADIIWVVDTSKSMNAEVLAVQKGVNEFSSFIAKKKVKSRVVMLAEASRICVPPPLGGPNCGNTSTFRHVDIKVGSHNALDKIIDSYPQWKSILAPVATRHFVLVSDDNANSSAAWFTKAIKELQSPGFPNGFVFHSIVADGPLADGGCNPNYGTSGYYGKKWGAKGEVYLELTKATGGVATSICGLTAWSKVFNAIADNVAESVIKLSCAHKLPAGSSADTVFLQHTDAAGNAVTLPRVANEKACPSTGHAWHFDNNGKPGKAQLCPSTCKAQAGQKLAFLHGCPVL